VRVDGQKYRLVGFDTPDRKGIWRVSTKNTANLATTLLDHLDDAPEIDITNELRANKIRLSGTSGQRLLNTDSKQNPRRGSRTDGGVQVDGVRLGDRTKVSRQGPHEYGSATIVFQQVQRMCSRVLRYQINNNFQSASFSRSFSLWLPKAARQRG
jgi:hypothetical protein